MGINKMCGSRIGQERGIIEAFKRIEAYHNRPVLEHNPPWPNSAAQRDFTELVLECFFYSS